MEHNQMGTPERITTVQQIGTYHNNPKGNNYNKYRNLKTHLGGGGYINSAIVATCPAYAVPRIFHSLWFYVPYPTCSFVKCCKKYK
nr:MAG TPA: hypothetical protein [Caudoviricetes sp.]